MLDLNPGLLVWLESQHSKIPLGRSALVDLILHNLAQHDGVERVAKALQEQQSAKVLWSREVPNNYRTHRPKI